MRFIMICLFLLTAWPLSAREMREAIPLIRPQSPVISMYVPLDLEQVKDGASFTASGREIRIWGIKAPGKDEPLYNVSTKALEIFIGNGALECNYMNTGNENAEIMHCLIDGYDLGALMVKTGFARDYPPSSQGFYDAEQSFAIEGRLGVWE